MPPENMGKLEVSYGWLQGEESEFDDALDRKCVCGHDVFYHDIQVDWKFLPDEPRSAKIGMCRAYKCKCRLYYGTDEWFNALWEQFKKYNEGYNEV